MANVTIKHLGPNGSGPYQCQLSNGRSMWPISPPYQYLTEAKIFRKAFELGRDNPDRLYNGFPIEYEKPSPPCGYTELESDYRDPDTKELKSRTAKCEGNGRLVIRGNGLDSFTDGNIFIQARSCPKCREGF